MLKLACSGAFSLLSRLTRWAFNPLVSITSTISRHRSYFFSVPAIVGGVSTGLYNQKLTHRQPNLFHRSPFWAGAPRNTIMVLGGHPNLPPMFESTSVCLMTSLLTIHAPTCITSVLSYHTRPSYESLQPLGDESDTSICHHNIHVSYIPHVVVRRTRVPPSVPHPSPPPFFHPHLENLIKKITLVIAGRTV